MLRLLNDEDIPAIAVIEQRLFTSGCWNESMIYQEVHAPCRTYYVVEHEGNVIAYGGIWFNGDDAELMTIGVDAPFQRRGIATTLIRALLHRAQELQARRMLLEVRVDNTPAIQCYQRLGFKIMGIRKRYYQPENIDAYTMQCAIGEENHE